eukprot:2350933-Rhodomonas_salina.2
MTWPSPCTVFHAAWRITSLVPDSSADMNSAAETVLSAGRLLSLLSSACAFSELPSIPTALLAHAPSIAPPAFCATIDLSRPAELETDPPSISSALLVTKAADPYDSHANPLVLTALREADAIDAISVAFMALALAPGEASASSAAVAASWFTRSDRAVFRESPTMLDALAQKSAELSRRRALPADVLDPTESSSERTAVVAP